MANANIKIKTDQYYLLTMRRAKTAELGLASKMSFWFIQLRPKISQIQNFNNNSIWYER